MIKELSFDDLKFENFQYFSRLQITTKKYTYENESLEVEEVNFINNWDENDLSTILKELIQEKEQGSYVVGKVENSKIIAFGCLKFERFGTKQQYVQLLALHVSNGSRGKGVGQQLFKMCVDKAAKSNVSKIFISAHPAFETQMFYKKVGCVLAQERNQALNELEPFDIQLEYNIKRA